MTHFEPKKGKLYYAKKDNKPTYAGFFLPIIDFVNPDTGELLGIGTSEFKVYDIVNTPLLFLKTDRRVATRRGHEHIEHDDLSTFTHDGRGGIHNQWDMNTLSADISYEYQFLYGNKIIATLIPANRSFGEFFDEANSG